MAVVALMVTALGLIGAGSAGAEGWGEWGGPGRDFGSSWKAPRHAQPVEWGELGPRILWWRDFGPGYSGIVTDGHALYTMTRQGEHERIVALAAADGENLWSYSYEAATDGLAAVDKSYGDAPQATPLLANGAVIGFGYTAVLSAVEAESGRLRWSRDLAQELSARPPYFGHAASPLPVDDAVVVLAGGVHAFDLADGEPRWHNRQLDGSYASPLLVEGPDGRQIVIAAAGEIVGLDAETGELLWRKEHANQHRTILSTPILGPDQTVFVSAYFLGSIALRLEPEGKARELWQQPDLQISHFNAVRNSDMVVASRDRRLMAVDLGSGEILWKEKGMGKSNLVRRGDDYLLLSDRGRLTLASMDRAGFRSRGSAQILEGRSWSPPTVVGDRLFARNGTSIVAVLWTKSAAGPGETLAGLRSRQPGSDVEMPEAFVNLTRDAEQAMQAGDPGWLVELAGHLEPWIEKPSTAAQALYFRGFLRWRLSYDQDWTQALAHVDAAIEDLKSALAANPRLADAHALLASLYPRYYSLAPGRAMAIGPLGDDHLAGALELEPENARVVAIQALDLIHSPKQYGGDPEKGFELLEQAVQLADGQSATVGPGWGRGLIRLWYAQQLVERSRVSEARRILTEAIEIYPGFRAAENLLAELPTKP